MPFIALNRHTQERINILLFDRPKEQIDKDTLVCQECGSSLFIKAGDIIRAHFCHRRDPDSNCKSRAESKDHQDAKLYIMEFLQARHPGATIELEVASRQAGRIADVLLIDRDGRRVAHEVQLSSIVTGELRERTMSYVQAGVDCIWWLGRKALTPANKQWCSDQRVFYCLYFTGGGIEHKEYIGIELDDLSRYLEENRLRISRCQWGKDGMLVARLYSDPLWYGETP